VDDRGRVMPIPKTYEERDKQPSDHRPVWMRLDRQGLLKAAGIKP